MTAKVDMGEIRKREADGLITVRKHPSLGLLLCDYTQKTQWDRLWDEYTRICRGLILDPEGNIIVRCLPKFHNVGEVEQTRRENLPAEVPAVTEKLDGSLGLLYWDGDTPCISTRGSFVSPQAGWATNWIRKRGVKRADFRKGYSYLFEIIYPENRVVCDYSGRAELVLLAVLYNDRGPELDHRDEATRLGFSYAKVLPPGSVTEIEERLKGLKGSEAEGVVCRYSNGLRIKMKCEDYRRLHKLLTGVSTLSIWESLMTTGSVESVLEQVPDEFFRWVRSVEARLRAEHNGIMTRGTDVASEARAASLAAVQSSGEGTGSRKDMALHIAKATQNAKGLSGIAFAVLDGDVQKAERGAWKQIRPRHEVFKVDEL